MNLDDIIYLIIKNNGEYIHIFRNNKYYNHYLYLNDLKQQDSYLKINSFGLEFKRDDQIPKIMFFKNLIDDGCIILESLKINVDQNISCFEILLPALITKNQKQLLDEIFNTNDIENLFIASYDEEINDFIPLYKNKEDLNNGQNILKNYINEHLEKVKEK